MKQQLTQTRQELSTALYQHDAAVRVIARLSRERDEARDALSKLTANGTSTSNGDAMQVDGQTLPDSLIAKVEATQERYASIFLDCGEYAMITNWFTRLSKTRRKRAVPDDWVTADLLQTFKPKPIAEPVYPGSRSLAVDSSGDMILLGGIDGSAGVFSKDQGKIVQTLKGGSGGITDSLWAGKRAVVATTSGSIKICDKESEISFSGHAGEATALALHPSEDLLASVGVDKSYIFYDLTSSKIATQVYTDSGE